MGFFKKIICFTAVLAGVILITQTAYACTCLERDIKKRWRDADVIFEGRILSLKRLPSYEMSPYDDVPVEVVFEVSKDYKGLRDKKNKKRFTLMTSLTQHTCAGFPFELEKKYLVFAYRRTMEAPEHWSLYKFPTESYGTGGLCGGTKNLADAKSDLVALRKWSEKPRKKDRGYSVPIEVLPQFGF